LEISGLESGDQAQVMSIDNAERRVRQLEAVPVAGAVWAVGEAIDAELSSFLTWSRRIIFRVLC
jgi:hypothetical protein